MAQRQGNHRQPFENQVRSPDGTFRGYDFTQAKDSHGHTNQVHFNIPDGVYNVVTELSKRSDNPFTSMSDIFREALYTRLDHWLDADKVPELKSQFAAEKMRYEQTLWFQRALNTKNDIDVLGEGIRDLMSTGKSWDKSQARKKVSAAFLNVFDKMTDPYFRILNLNTLLDNSHIKPLIPKTFKDRALKEIKAWDKVERKKIVKMTETPEITESPQGPVPIEE
jgi:hypothetical protein